MLPPARRRGFPADEVVPFASRALGRARELAGEAVQPLADDTIEGFDIALFCAGGATSREWAPRFADGRRDRRRQLVGAGGWTPTSRSSSPRSTPDALDGRRKGIVANPNCTTMVVMLPLKALHDAFGLRAMVATSFQAAGGAGQKGIDELAAQVAGRCSRTSTRSSTDGAAAARRSSTSVHADTLAFNVVPMLGTLGEEGYTDEEIKLQNESRKILDLPDLAVSPTCVRVPVMVGHAVAVRATFAREVDLDEALRRARGVPEPRRRGRRRRRWSGPGATRRRRPRARATSPTRRASTSSSSATTCSRARR